MKKTKIAILLTAVMIFAFVAGGAAFAMKETEIVLIENGETVFANGYELKFSTALKVLLYYGGNYYKYYKNEHYGDPNGCLRTLNCDIAADVQAYAASVYQEKSDASVDFCDGKFTFVTEADGWYLDTDCVLEGVIANLSKTTTVEVARQKIEPEVTVEELKKNTVPMAEYRTEFAASGQNRRKNIAIAAEKLNNTVVPAGGELSFNAVVGERSEANGFVEAKIIKDGEFVAGVGGGVCQVSTTLFNCWLKAGLGVKTAAAHSLPVSYVKPSLDAMVSSATDLVLVNDTDYPVYVRAYVSGDFVYFNLYGRPLDYDVVLRSVTVKTLSGEYETVTEDEADPIDWAEDETERIIKRAEDGLISESYRDYYVDGQLVKSERLRKNTYKMQKGKKVQRKKSPDSE